MRIPWRLGFGLALATVLGATGWGTATSAEQAASKPAASKQEEKPDVPVTTPKGKPPADFVVARDAAPLAYQVAPVPNGGTISGKVAFTGNAPPPKRFKVEKTPEICGAEDRLLAEVRVNGGALADVVLVLEGVKAGKPFADFAITGPPPGRREQKGTNDKFMGTTLRPEKCIFGAFTGVVANGSVIRFDNMDPVKHSPHTYEVRGRVRDSLHNQDLEGNGFLKLGVKFSRATAKLVRLECDQHEHMQNWFYRVDSPYYAFSAADGTFTIDQIPPGTYTLTAWHPVLGDLEEEVTVTAKGTSKADFEFSTDSGRRRRR